MNACARWMALVDREAVGETLAAGDAAFARRHAAHCSACAVEAAAWSGLGQMDTRGVEADVERVLASLAPTRRPRRVRAWAAVALAGVGTAAAAAGALLWMGAHVRPEGRFDLVVASGAVEIDGHPAVAGDRLAVGAQIRASDGTACFTMNAGAYACLSDGGEARMEDASPAHGRVALLHGKIVVAVDPAPRAATFSVSTAAGSVTSADGSFAVELTPAGPTVRSLHGMLAVALPAGVVDGLVDHETLVAGGARRASTDGEERSDAAVLAPRRAFSSASSGTLTIRTAPSAARVIVDGVALGTSPVSAVLGAGQHTLSVAGRASEPFELAVGQHLVRTLELAARASPGPAETHAAPSAEPAPAPSIAPPGPPAAPAPPSVDEMLATARSLRGDGRYADAAGVYRKLIAAHPRDAASFAGLVSLGDLQLDHLGDAAGALASYRAYARHRGPLALEARHGEIRSLRRLGRVGEERRAIEAFLADYPSSPQAPALRARLGGLPAAP